MFAIRWARDEPLVIGLKAGAGPSLYGDGEVSIQDVPELDVGKCEIVAA